MEKNRMATMDIKKLVLVNGVPLMLSLLISNLYNFVDSIFVSHVSEKALTALALANPIQILMSALGVANAVGLNAVISKALGEKNDEEVKRSASAAIWLAFVFWIILAITSLFLLKPYFLSQSGGDHEIANYGIAYLSIVMFMSLGFMGQWVFDRFTIASGKSNLFLFTLSSGAITNLILDPIFIFGYFGIPAMGIVGAAIATVIGQFVGASLGIILNKKYNKEIPIHFVIKPHFKNVLNILKVGVPSGIAQGMLSVMGVYVNSILISFSSTAVAVYGACAKIQSLALVPIWGLNNGVVPLVAYNYGAKNLKRSYDSLKWTIIYEYGIYLVIFIFIECFPGVILKLFDASPDMIAMGSVAIRILGISYLISILCLAFASSFQGFGRGIHSMSLTLARQTIFLFIFLVLFKQFGQVNLIWWAYILAEAVSVPLGILMHKRIQKQVTLEMEE
ncbi:MAG: MATE family efflux transporter [Beduini sp.]|uniref:MATE family efflux transporter n=1 Tax=Beduini sp. TaxID=1922300 RepID=UPI0011C8331E